MKIFLRVKTNCKCGTSWTWIWALHFRRVDQCDIMGLLVHRNALNDCNGMIALKCSLCRCSGFFEVLVTPIKNWNCWSVNEQFTVPEPKCEKSDQKVKTMQDKTLISFSKTIRNKKRDGECLPLHGINRFWRLGQSFHIFGFVTVLILLRKIMFSSMRYRNTCSSLCTSYHSSIQRVAQILFQCENIWEHFL